MKDKKDYTNFFIYFILCSVVLIFTYLSLTEYIPFINVAEIQYVLDSDSDLEIGIKDKEENCKITNTNVRIKVYNLLKRTMLRKKLFASEYNSEKNVYYINFKNVMLDGNSIECKIDILENGMLIVNGELFHTSENIYNTINYMFLENDNI